MKKTISKDKKRLMLEKYFSDEERLSAECLNMKVESQNVVIFDIRKTCKSALLLFMENTDRTLMTNPRFKKDKDAFMKTINELYRNDAIEFVKRYNPLELYKNINRKLNKYQLETIWAKRNCKYSLCAFEQGLGKTVYAASMSKLFNIKRTLVICPSLVKWNWFMDLTEDWGFNSLSFTILDREKPMRAILQEAFVIVNFESIERFMPEIYSSEVEHIIIDEIHYAKNTTSARSKTVKKVVNKFPNARVTMLTGTPMKNRIVDMYALLNLSDHPMGRSYPEFVKRFARTSGRKIVGIKNPEDFRLKLSNFMVRKKSEEELDLPELNIRRYYFAMDSKSTIEYNLIIEEMYENEKNVLLYEQEMDSIKKRLVAKTIPDNETAGAKLRLQQLVTLKKSGSMSKKGNIMTLNRLCAESKIDSILELVKEYNRQGEKVVVFSFFKTVLQKLQYKIGKESVLIDGSVSAIKRRDYITKFKKDDSVKVFLGQSIAAGIGINLVNACKVIFCDLPFTTDLLEQPYKRVHRQGQKKDVEVVYAMVPDSIDDKIYALLKGKSDDINTVIDHGKEGNVNYGSLEKKLFTSLLKSFEKKNNITESIIPKGFVKVK